MNSDTLVYNKPANYYMKALPIGNGSIGAMCYSGVKTDEISLNHDTLWSGYPRTVTRESAFKSYQRAQKLALDGKYKECHDEIEQNFLTCWSQAYLTCGTIKLIFNFDEYSDYSRELDLSKAVLSSQFSADGNTYKKLLLCHILIRLWFIKSSRKTAVLFHFMQIWIVRLKVKFT